MEKYEETSIQIVRVLFIPLLQNIMRACLDNAPVLVHIYLLVRKDWEMPVGSFEIVPENTYYCFIG